MDNGHMLALTSAELDAALARAQNISNPNLLDNWYFGNPVDQRGGWVVPPGATYYTGAWEPAGVTDTYYALKITAYHTNNKPYGTINVNGAEYNVSAETPGLSRGYIGKGSYSIDRWILQYDTNLELVGDAVRMSGKWDLKQILERTLPNGTYTASVLYKNAEVANDFYIYLDDSNGVPIFGSNTKETAGLLSCTFTVSGNDINCVRLAMQDNSGNSKVDILAVKLELGSQQTLAHQENGVWVLNEIPNYAEELAKCQRYYQVYDNYIWMIPCKDNVWRLNHAFPVAMRVAPAVVSHEAISDKEATVTFDSVTANGVSAFGTGDGQYVAVSNIVFDANL